MFLVFVQHASLCFSLKIGLEAVLREARLLRASCEKCLTEIKSHIFHTETLATALRVFHD